MSDDLNEARKIPLFNSDALTELIWAPQSRKAINQLIAVLQKEPLFNKIERLYLNRRQLLSRAFKCQIRLLELQQQHNWDRNILLQAIVHLDSPSSLFTHLTAFMAVIESQGTIEQIREWIPRSERMEILGCYAQTELGHGSNVQGLETTATYILDSDEFEIDSPTLTSTKWWIGGLGVMATHALVQASLFINSKPFGPHLFIVPVRSLKDLSPLPNIQVGDIGSKAFGGMATIDNGYARFNRVRIPRKNMLQRYSQVSSKGEFTHPKQEKLSYGSMINLRVAVASYEALNLARALTIAVRYTTVRRQFSTKGKREDQVITYSSVKHRLFPLLGVAFAYTLAGKGLMMAYMEMMGELISQGESRRLAEVHAISSGLKACCTWDCLAGIEECRKACGGHGYSAYAGIGQIWANGVASQTYEGDNYVISQQTARACLKYMANPTNLPPSAEYLAHSRNPTIGIATVADWKLSDIQLQVLEVRARQAVMKLGERMQSGIAWKDLNMDCVSVSRAHIEVFVLRTFINTISAISESSLIMPLTKLLNLYSLHILTNAAADLLTHEIITPSHAQMLADAYRAEVIEMTPREVVQITDAFAFSDYELGGVLGRYDGRVYEALLEEARKDPVNTEMELKEYVLEMMRGNWRKQSKL